MLANLNCFIHTLTYFKDAMWGQWSQWTTCSKTCLQGIETRQRECNNPPPTFGGRDCIGNGTDTKTCVILACCDCKCLCNAKTDYHKTIFLMVH